MEGGEKSTSSPTRRRGLLLDEDEEAPSASCGGSCGSEPLTEEEGGRRTSQRQRGIYSRPGRARPGRNELWMGVSFGLGRRALEFLPFLFLFYLNNLHNISPMGCKFTVSLSFDERSDLPRIKYIRV
jgi:hypothetical protein